MKNVKIALPPYKIAYSFIFLLLLSLVRGINQVSDIGAAMDPLFSLLVIVFCGDTFETEKREKRWEIFVLFPLKNQAAAISARLFIQVMYLTGAGCVGYWFFYWQKPVAMNGESQSMLYLMYILASITSAFFWGTLSMTLVNLLRNLWAGIGISIIIWFFMFSKAGDALLGIFNNFAFTFRSSEQIMNFSWLWGKLIWSAAAVFMMLTITWQLRLNKNKY